MMRVLIVLACLLGLWVAPAWAAEGSADYELGVDGLSCPFCAYGIEKELAAVDGVEAVGVDLAGGMVRVRMKEGASLDEATARKAAREAGFELRSFGRVAGE